MNAPTLTCIIDASFENKLGFLMFKRISILLAALTFSLSAQATLIDFTDDSWLTAINAGGGTTATIGNATLTANTGYLTFNANDNAGCIAGQPINGLTCDGDGIGIYNDEISEGGSQQVTVSFNEAVNISNIFLLDLFSSEQTGEIAIIDGIEYFGDNLLAGGFYATGYTGQGITSLTFSGNLDSFSDYAVAGIEVSAVPLPGAVVLFGTALLGFFGVGASRRRAV